jgi:hypothetical protein
MERNLVPSESEADHFVEKDCRRHYTFIPSPWLLLAGALLLGLWAWLETPAEARPSPLATFIATGVAVAVAVPFLSRLSAYVDARNERAKRAAMRRSREIYATLCNDLEDMSNEAVEILSRFRSIVKARRYAEYIPLAEALVEKLHAIDDLAPRVQRGTPPRVDEARDCLRTILSEVEADPDAVAVYEPALAFTLEEMEARAEALNVVDFDEFSEQFLRLLISIQRRKEPFDFSERALALFRRFLRCRDRLLGSPEHARLWLDITRAKEELAEARRHHEQMEDAEWAQVNELRKQTTALRFIAIAEAADAFYTRKIARALDGSSSRRA